MYARVIGSSGAVADFFTYDDSNESDIEIVTDDNSTTWHFTNQPSVDKNRKLYRRVVLRLRTSPYGMSGTSGESIGPLA